MAGAEPHANQQQPHTENMPSTGRKQHSSPHQAHHTIILVKGGGTNMNNTNTELQATHQTKHKKRAAESETKHINRYKTG